MSLQIHLETKLEQIRSKSNKWKIRRYSASLNLLIDILKMDDEKLLGILRNFVGEKTTFKIANKIGMSSEI